MFPSCWGRSGNREENASWIIRNGAGGEISGAETGT